MTEIKILGAIPDSLKEKIDQKDFSYDMRFFFVDYVQQDVEVGFVFNEFRDDLGSKEAVNAVLGFVTQQYFAALPFIPKGYKSIVGLRVIEGDHLFKGIPVISSWSSSSSVFRLSFP